MEELKQKGTAIVGEVFTSFWKEKVSCEVGRERDLACKGREEASAPGKISFLRHTYVWLSSSQAGSAPYKPQLSWADGGRRLGEEGDSHGAQKGAATGLRKG